MAKKSRKTKKTNSIKLDMTSWNTTDADEITRRRLRGQIEKFSIKNTEPNHVYFGSFEVHSTRDKKYHVEIRSLSDCINSCDCPDYRSNGLSTCKHIEHVLFRLKKLGKKKFDQADKIGTPRVEIFLDTRETLVICIAHPQKNSPHLKPLDSFFSTDKTLLGNPIIAFPELQRAISQNKKLGGNLIRISHHIDHFIENQRLASKKHIQKETFLADVKLGKKTLDIAKFSLYPYQQEGMLHLAFNQRALLADEMGLGKTVQAIAACELLHREENIQRVLIIATASLKAEWEEQIAKFSGLSSLIIQGTRPDRLRQYQCHAFFYLANYEQILMDGPDIQRLLMPDVIILDEAQRIKNWQTKTANTIKQLKSPYAFVLTGTPIENKIDDIYSIVQFLDPRVFGPLFRFNRNFYELDEKGKPIGYKNLDELHRRLRPIMLRRLKNDVEGQLPERTVNNYFVPMDNEQLIRYDEYQNKVARLLYQAKRRPLRKEEFEKLQRWLACMRMLCDTPFILDPDCRVSPKINELENILDELLSDETSKIIIFSEWERMLQLVRKLTQKKQLSIAWHTGSVPQQKRREEINRFKNNPDCRLFLSTDSGSVGLNLQTANIVINLDLPWNPAKLEQRIARAWRKHQTRSVQIINLICENSIEHRMLHLLAEKQALADGVLQGKDDLTEMKLPSGRAAFMERMENLMGSSLHAVDPDTQPKPTPTKSLQDIRSELLTQFPDQIGLLQSHQNPETGQQTLFAVVDQPSESIKSVLSNTALSLEMLDRNTFETIQRLAKAGIISFNNPTEMLYTSPQFSESRMQLHEKKLNQARKKLEQAARKQRMAQVLIESDFHEEAIQPLREALESTIHSFSCLMRESENAAHDISHHFIKNTLIDQHGLPQKTVELFTQLTDKVQHDKIKNLFTDHQDIFQHVDEALNKAALVTFPTANAY